MSPESSHTPLSISSDQDIPNVDLIQPSFAVFLNVDIDGEMRVDITHFVFESPANSNDQVVDNGLDGAKGCDILAGAMVEFNVNHGFRGSGEAD